MTPDGQVEYNTAPLVNGEKVPELWNESGNVCVYLHPKQSGRGPSFRVADQIFSASAVLNELLVTEMMAASGLYPDAASATRPVTEGHLYLPLGNTDLDCLVAARNLFALLTHQPLVGTAEHPTLFATLLQVAGLLRRFNFTSYDGSSMGESVDTAFGLLMDEFGIADVRHSREKTLEALILAEQMKSWNLYNEAFVHAVGKYEALRHLKSPLFDRISVSTRKRLDRAHLDLAGRRANVNTRLEAFEFPSLFAGIASSTSTEEYKRVRFKEWRNAFGKMRSFVLGYYKSLFGNWPPRARSHKNYFSQSGLNRQCLKILYSDFCALYDLLVDRQSITPRVIGEMYDDPSEGSKEKQLGDASISALRKVLSEFDKSSPPVLPPIPFDIPKIPSMTAVYENFHEMPAKKQAKYSKAVQPHELQLILLKARNIDTDALQFPFLLAYKDFELREARGASPQDLADQRIGYWLFLYAVLQSLPMLVVDAPGLRYTEGVEDFLCEAPQGNPPWTEDAGEVRKMWYQTAGQNIVELSADVVMFSVEGIYMRSHCWLAAKEWEALGPAQQQQQQQQQPSPPPQLSPLQPPRAVFHDMDPFSSSSSPSAGGPPHNNPPDPTTTTSTTTTTSHQQSPASLAAASPGPSAHNSPHLRPRAGSTDERARQAFRASIAIGLEPLALPPPAAAAAMGMGGVHQRASSRVLSAGSLLAPAGAGINGLNGINGGINGGVNGGGGAVAAGGLGAGLGGLGEGRPQPGMLRASRSAVALSQFGGGIGGISGGGAGGEFLGDAAHQYQQQQLRKSSYGGAPGLGHAASESLGGGSTFDDILKGMDHGKKTKKKLFF
ncbi:da0622e4-3f84-4575-b7ed-86f6c5458d18 [Thermothielavioides terrestris]|uniref:Da0622e4-3f84-4575-b7ed-86f6c5458d18 n=1 Tax=Thermothielavioides terrestris TaxID=2587410 RepID=A0A446B734_9PEZI|nr:da0622e4-3f84-4575-b7ed-86f6c5458d18 [Thermothielavioides terrestris]